MCLVHTKMLISCSAELDGNLHHACILWNESDAEGFMVKIYMKENTRCQNAKKRMQRHIKSDINANMCTANLCLFMEFLCKHNVNGPLSPSRRNLSHWSNAGGNHSDWQNISNMNKRHVLVQAACSHHQILLAKRIITQCIRKACHICTSCNIFSIFFKQTWNTTF